jgi:diadenosine tetraphosphate (Ap4A) HIT family hydrolase
MGATMMFEDITCPFCKIDKKDWVLYNEHAYAIYDKYPVNKGHTLIIPRLHDANYFNVTNKESLWQLVGETKKLVDALYNPDGYNIGINVGEPAGQTVFHCHIHLIPRYKGDTEHDHRGGVRLAVPERGHYLD